MDKLPNPTSVEIAAELVFSASRSSGPGGQNVNKVNSRITLNWDVLNSALVTEEQKQMLLKKLSARMTKAGVLILTAQDSRSQRQNKDDVVAKLDQLMQKAFEKQKSRKATRPNKAAKRKRLDNKKLHGEKKQWRKKL